MKAVLFDLDGTLLDTLRDIADSCNSALVAHGLRAHPIEAYRHFVGDGVPNLMRRVIPPGHHDPATLAAVAASYREEYLRRWNATSRPYAGVPEMLDELARRKIALAVLSNKPDDFTRRFVAELLPQWSFAAVLGASEAFPHKPDPASAIHIANTLRVPPAEFVYLGDTATDMRTAAGAGMLPVGALWGFRDEAELRASGARRLLNRPQQLLDLFQD